MLFCVTILVVLTAFAEGSQMVVDQKNPLMAAWNGSTFNIENVFQWPVTVSDDPRGYVYRWNPNGGSCVFATEPENHVAVCQLPHINNGGLGYACGREPQAVWVLNGWNPIDFTIIYYGGDEWRFTVVNFIEDKQQVQSHSFISALRKTLHFPI
eukprot:TRINITY_DN5515_c0_g1_i2.p1 TRINITY_DN5515_c0_g1~~TRINITY_DN5515_c0_g1_i2.p1  ORF type:complete len:173 (-),score=18.59 TRINITY_DN5515_c0_g1_i2:253-714(-)